MIFSGFCNTRCVSMNIQENMHCFIIQAKWKFSFVQIKLLFPKDIDMEMNKLLLVIVDYQQKIWIYSKMCWYKFSSCKLTPIENVFFFSDTTGVQCLLTCRSSVRFFFQRILRFMCKFINRFSGDLKEIFLFFKCCCSRQIVEQMFKGYS